MEPDTKSARSRFLGKSKWGKVFKEDDSKDPNRKGNFKLNEDVVDFLKPSTDKTSRPKIDIVTAQRWPNAHEVARSAAPLSAAAEQRSHDFPPSQAQDINGLRKRRRREGLTVGFARTAPDVIGEGGDEADDPPSEIGRRKAVVQRSVSARIPNNQDDGKPWPGTAQTQRKEQGGVQPPPVIRAQTSGYEVSPAVQKRTAPPPPRQEQPPPLRIGISRTPTGFNSADSEVHGVEEDVPPMPSISPPFEERGGGQEDSLKVKKQHDMRASEGMAFRRASQLIGKMDVPAEDLDIDAGIAALALEDDRKPSSSYYDAPQSASTVSQDSASPFADPRYMDRRAREQPRQPSQTQPPVQQQQRRVMEPPSYMRQPPSGVPPDSANLQQRPIRRDEQPSYMRANEAPGSLPRQGREDQQPSYMKPAGQAPNSGVDRRPQPAQSASTSPEHMQAPQVSSRNRERSPLRDHVFDSQQAQNPAALSARPNGSHNGVNHFVPYQQPSHPQGNTDISPQRRQGSHLRPYADSQSPPSLNPSAENRSPRNSLSAQPHPSPYARGPSPNDYFSVPKPAYPQQGRSPAASIRQEESRRPSSSGSSHSPYRPAASPQPLAGGNPAGDAALADFASRVAHMKGVFRLTAEKERPGDKCSPNAWLRAALWWYLRGKAGLEGLLQQRSRSLESSPREVLTQAHVDLAKAWWILAEPLEHYDSPDGGTPQSAHSRHDPLAALRSGCSVLRSYLRSLCASIGRSNIMPPPQSLIQGQDTQIWLEYPRFSPDAAAVLGGSVGNTVVSQPTREALSPLEALPLGDTRGDHCYARFFVEASISTDEAETDRVVIPCVLSLLRSKGDFQSSIVIASQNELVAIHVGPDSNNSSETSWHEVGWRASSTTISLRLPRGFDMTVRLQERDYRSLWNTVEYMRKIDHSLRAEQNETMVHEAHLSELQYADSSNPNAFPADKLRSCMAFVFERQIEEADSSSVRKKHRGFRLLLVTDPGHKTLSTASHEIDKNGPLYFEFITDAAANGTTAMVLRVREESRQCRMLLVFKDGHSRQDFYDVLNGLNVASDETIVGKMSLTGFNIQPSMQAGGGSVAMSGPLSQLQWQKLGVTNHASSDPNSRARTVESESLRIVARHTHGCITDRFNLGKGELQLRLPCTDTPTIQILRQPQEDLSTSIDTRHAPPNVPEGIAELMKTIQHQPTIRTLTFASSADLHAFQTATTGLTVRFDGLASTLGISRRMMVVPIYHKWTANNVRLQIVSNAQNTVIQLLAFMEDFAHADALCLKIKSTDTFEAVKGDSKGKKWAVKFVDAKFKLPRAEKGEKGGDVGAAAAAVDEAERVRRRFVNLEGLEYAEEHDDITVGFETQEARDRFAAALPAATTVGRMITLKRRI